MTRTLDDLMEFDHVIRVHPDGTITDENSVYGPEGIEMETLDDDAGSIMESHEIAYAAAVERQGWQLMRGYTGQYAAKRSNYVMHTSEYIGGRMEQDIRETPGLYVAIVIETTDPKTGEFRNEAAGWAVAYRRDEE